MRMRSQPIVFKEIAGTREHIMSTSGGAGRGEECATQKVERPFNVYGDDTGREWVKLYWTVPHLTEECIRLWTERCIGE